MHFRCTLDNQIQRGSAVPRPFDPMPFKKAVRQGVKVENAPFWKMKRAIFRTRRLPEALDAEVQFRGPVSARHDDRLQRILLPSSDRCRDLGLSIQRGNQ